MSKFKAMIDCDVLVYASAFGAQKTRYDVTLPGSTAVLTFMDAKERDEYLKVEGVSKADCVIEKWLDVLPEAVAISIAKNNLQGILDELKTDKFEAFLTGPGNYREQIAVTKPYKGNRDSEKPVHYELVKDWFITKVGAVIVEGKEADDQLGIMATKDIHNIICTIDKDLNQVPGLHYDWNIQKKYRVGKEDADRFFITQLLIGDATDNIPGVERFGIKSAEKLYATALAQADGNKKHANTLFFKAALDTYAKKGYTQEYIEEQGRLLWIQRKADEPLWTIQGFKKTL